MLDHIFGAAPLLSVLPAGDGELTEVILKLLIQLSIILFAAKMAGEICIRFLKLPPVLGELAIGVAIGPFALGALPIPGFGPLFPLPLTPDGHPELVPIGHELFSIAQIGSVLLLFGIGLETNLRQFLRYVGPATAVALGGVIVPFALGVGATVIFGFDGGGGIFAPPALFMGALLTATSVGITARVLADLNRLDSPEGVTVLAAAVVDDVLGILVLTMVVGVSTVGAFSLGGISWVAFKAIAFWLGLSAVGILVAPYLEKGIGHLRVPGSALVLTIALALLAAGLAEAFGLAFIIGAFSIGLALSNTDMAHRVERELVPLNEVIVPVFFVVMGMQVNVAEMGASVVFGLVVSVLAAGSKVFGSGIPAFFSGFNLRGSSRIGFGMMPRGEVALIIAGIGLSQGIIGQELFGVSIMMTVLTTLLAPMALIPLFKSGGSGTRRPETGPDGTAMPAGEAQGSH